MVCRVSGYGPLHGVTTVVPALGDPRRERPPAVCGHVINVPTHFNVKLPAIGGHLPNADADSHLLVVLTAITDSVSKSRVFGGYFNPKSLMRSTVRSNFSAVVW